MSASWAPVEGRNKTGLKQQHPCFAVHNKTIDPLYSVHILTVLSGYSVLRRKNMKQTIKILVLLSILALAGTISLSAENRGRGMENLLEGVEVTEVDDSEIKGLLLMREEEKLARDVYTAFYQQWGLNVFRNIARSEETHMEAVGILLERYNIDDPVNDDTQGSFTDPDFAELYQKLVDRGAASLSEAISVGAMIEDLDIADLIRLINTTDNDDIKIVYQNLLKGSRNHLRSFLYHTERNGETYTPQYISDELFVRIVESERETGKQITDPDFKF
jgi:hypothetical protein